MIVDMDPALHALNTALRDGVYVIDTKVTESTVNGQVVISIEKGKKVLKEIRIFDDVVSSTELKNVVALTIARSRLIPHETFRSTTACTNEFTILYTAPLAYIKPEGMWSIFRVGDAALQKEGWFLKDAMSSLDDNPKPNRHILRAIYEVMSG